MGITQRHLLITLLIALFLSWSTGCKGQQGGADRVSDSGYPMAPESIRTAEVELTDGSTFRVADHQGKVILLNLWATWCGPCRNEIPELVALQEKYKDKGLMIVGLDVDPEPLELVKPFAEEMAINYKLGWAGEDLVEGLFRYTERNGIPQSFLINRNGEMNGVFFGGDPSVVAKMKELVSELVEKQ